MVYTDWLSMMDALGVASRPAASRTRARKVSSTRSQAPSSRQFPKYDQTVLPRRQVMEHQPPGYAVPQHVEDAVDHLTQIRGSAKAPFGVGRQ